MGTSDYFWSRVDRTGDCWLMGTTTGYAWFGDGSTAWSMGERLAHRIAWARVHGPIPDGYVVTHTCGHRNCVRPEHLDCVPHHQVDRRRRKAHWIYDDL